ncbi:neurogenic locus notch homolog protein 1-like isoform X3 [Lytechinus variegatus]|uniref:neurogenic locus notch homolog protein 1-like isoform X3 n=1 Tax=Lytechinus variegatus TaxID=7654 RepID=UPI001BB2813A|nr:neurogenic locus notch homolog protein 1-like isoform X3 [Lytechinus variegatus]
MANFLVRIVFTISVLVYSTKSEQSHCGHKPLLLTPKNRIHVQRPKTTQSRILTPDQRMKTHVEYDQSVLDLDVASDIQDAVAEVVERISKTLSVKQDPGFFLFPKDCEDPMSATIIDGQVYCTVGSCYAPVCGEIIVPESLSEPCYDCYDDGTNCLGFGGRDITELTEMVHFTLFVGSINTSCDSGTIAYASACYLDDVSDRPIAGFMNICPLGLQLVRERLLSVIQHEIFHALGFSHGLYAFFRDKDGEPLTPRESNGLPPFNSDTGVYQWSDQVIKELSISWESPGGTAQRAVQALVTPNIVREARAHFGCPTLAGLEIEDGGGAGTALSHFEKRILATESMNGYLAPVSAFSRMTLALLEDTGWYIPDYDQADRLNWGKDLGCDFVQKSCHNWINTKQNAGQSLLPWCTEIGETACHAEGVDVAVCGFYEYDQPIPTVFQIFGTTIGGTDLADYCPYHQVNSFAPRNQTANDLYCTNKEIVNDCRVNDCMNGGVCRDVIDGYYCDCPVGYAGAVCDHENVDCTLGADCEVNEVCSERNECECERGRTRQNDVCIGVSEVKEYSMTLVVSEVNGEPAVYDPSLLGPEGEQFRHSIEYEIRQIIGNDASLRVALVEVVARNISSGSIVVDIAMIFRENASDNSTNISLASVVAATTTDQNILQESGTAFTIMWNASVVQDANECEDGAGNDCSQSARCTNTDGSYECACLQGYEDTGQSGVLPGRNCTEINECDTNPCLHGATCTDKINGYNCTCAAGYTGNRCETEMNECDTNPCLHGATCTDEINGYNCTCAAGYTGNECETDIDECNVNPCLNGATCTDEINAYNCTCAAGYTGNECETEIDECYVNPCLNGATCTDEINGYNCTCIAGYTGNQCETDINECNTNPCLNGATCMDEINGYNCTCVAGYTGNECETDVDECLSSPCQNDATCSSLATNVLCECPEGYSGDQCQIEPVTCLGANSCGELEICNTEGMCECGPNYIENSNGQCEVAYVYTVSMTITSFNGQSISFTIALTDVTSDEYLRLAAILRRLLLLQVRLLRRLARIIFRNGSVIASFEAGTAEPMSANDLQQMIISDLGSGNITSGGSSIGVDPDTLVATDFNECLVASDNDCSPNADCSNMEGSFVCSCREGFTDNSPDTGRPGRVCTVGGLSKGAIISLSLGLGMVFIFTLLTCTACLFMQSKANAFYNEYYKRPIGRKPRHPPLRTRDRSRNFRSDMDQNFDNGIYGAPRSPGLTALHGDRTKNWYLRDGRGLMDSPFASRGPNYYTSPTRGHFARPSRNRQPPRYSAHSGNQASWTDYEDPLPPYSRREGPEEDNEFHRPNYASGNVFY